MTTPVKEYQNVSFQELLQYATHNPNRSRTLDPIEIVNQKKSQDHSLDSFGLHGYQSYSLEPTGALSLLACIQDPTYFSLLATNARIQQIIDITTSLQEQTEQLRNTSLRLKRKKIYDLIGAVFNGKILEDKEYQDLFQGISFLKEIQFILIKSAVQENIEEGEKQYDSSLKGEVLFSSRPDCWKRDQPVWVVDFRARWVAIPHDKHIEPLSSILSTWILFMERNGWIVQWPEIDGTKTELVEQLSLLPGWQPTDKSLKKETLSARLGKINTMNLFQSWNTSPQDEQKA